MWVLSNTGLRNIKSTQADYNLRLIASASQCDVAWFEHSAWGAALDWGSKFINLKIDKVLCSGLKFEDLRTAYFATMEIRRQSIFTQNSSYTYIISHEQKATSSLVLCHEWQNNLIWIHPVVCWVNTCYKSIKMTPDWAASCLWYFTLNCFEYTCNCIQLYWFRFTDFPTKNFQNMWSGIPNILGEPKIHSHSICKSENVWQKSLKWVAFLWKWVANLQNVWQWVKGWQTHLSGRKWGKIPQMRGSWQVWIQWF